MPPAKTKSTAEPVPAKRLKTINRINSPHAVVAVAAAVVLGFMLVRTFAASGNIIFSEDFNGINRLMTNEYAYYHPDCDRQASRWYLTSGSLYRLNNQGYSGKIDRHSVDCHSTTGTNSAVFRMVSKKANFGNMTLDLSFKEIAFVPTESFDGLHVWLRYQSPQALYAVSVGRRDHTMVVKKKIPGGPSNDGYYIDLAPPITNTTATAANVHHHSTISVWDDASKVVHIKLVQDGKSIMEVTDRGTIGPAYHDGRIGVRGDNTEFYLDNIIARQL